MTTNDIQNAVSTPELLLRHGYKYLEQIGEGSNGKTYKAKNLKTGEIVAIKALKFSDNLKNYELFEREAQTLKSIHTPGTPVFYDYITSGSEFTECWLVQEYIQGESIFDKLERGQTFDEAQTLETLMEAAQIIQTLQTKYTPPIIHRDIKPSNILVRETPKDDMKLCLIDFGAVANPQRRGVNSTVAGTVGYMAPEQLIGDCTVQSDYYALGATALHMLTGINPSEISSDGFTLQFEDILKQKVPGIHKETIALLHILLATNPTDRPNDANDLIQQILKTISSFSKIVRRQETWLDLKIKFLDYIYELDGKIPYIIMLIITVAVSTPIIIIYFYFFFIKFNKSIPSDAYGIYASGIIITILIEISGLVRLFIEKSIKKSKAQQAELPMPLELTKPELTNPQKVPNAAGVIQTIHGDIIEYTAPKGKEYYTAFTKVKTPSKYRVGDKITIN